MAATSHDGDVIYGTILLNIRNVSYLVAEIEYSLDKPISGYAEITRTADHFRLPELGDVFALDVLGSKVVVCIQKREMVLKRDSEHRIRIEFEEVV